MIGQELVHAGVQERMREAAERRRQAQALGGQDGSPRRVLSGLRTLRLSLPSFVAHGSRTASVT